LEKEMKQYGIKVPMAKDDWLWVTTGTPDPETLELKVMLFNKIGDAQKVADKFGPLAMAKEYDV
jgi:hypothetical protein